MAMRQMAHHLHRLSLGLFSGKAQQGALLDLHYPTWQEARAELNALPLGFLGR